MRTLMIGLAFAGILASLAGAFVFMMKDSNPAHEPRKPRTVWALTLRIALSVALFVGLWVSATFFA
jgi:hypothetical protein